MWGGRPPWQVLSRVVAVWRTRRGGSVHRGLHGTERQIFGSLDLGRIRAVKYRRRVPGIHNKRIFQRRLHDGAARAGEGQQYATCVGTSGVKN